MTEIRIRPERLDSEALLSEILTFEQNWDAKVNVQTVKSLIDKIILQGREAMDNTSYSQVISGRLCELNEVLDNFYLDQAFSSTGQQIPESMLNSLSYLVQYHTGECLSMSLLLNHVLVQLGFDSEIKAVGHDLMVEVTISAKEVCLIEATTGEQYTHFEDETHQVLPTEHYMAHRSMDKQSLEQLFLTQQKMAFTRERQLDKALCCIDLLIQTTPDDPYQRRDRGFLLHQLDCANLAKDDFEFFIDQCPEDPAAQLLKSQLEEFDFSKHTVH